MQSKEDVLDYLKDSLYSFSKCASLLSTNFRAFPKTFKMPLILMLKNCLFPNTQNKIKQMASLIILHLKCSYLSTHHKYGQGKRGLVLKN